MNKINIPITVKGLLIMLIPALMATSSIGALVFERERLEKQKQYFVRKQRMAAVAADMLCSESRIAYAFYKYQLDHSLVVDVSHHQAAFEQQQKLFFDTLPEFADPSTTTSLHMQMRQLNDFARSVFAKLGREDSQSVSKFLSANQLWAQKSFLSVNAELRRIIANSAAYDSATQMQVSSYQELQFEALRLMILTTIVCILAGLIFGAGIATRIQNLVKQLENPSAASLTAASKQSDEIAVLERSIAKMFASLSSLSQAEASLYSAVSDLLLALDKQLCVIRASDSARETIGFESDVALRLDQFVPTRDFVELQNRLEQCRISSPHVSCESRLLSATGNLLDVVWSISWSAADETYYCVIQNVTKEHQLHRAREQALSVISHDVRTPLNSVMANLQTIETSCPDIRPTDAALLRQTEMELCQASELVDNVLELSKYRSVRVAANKTVFRFSSCLSDAYQQLEELIEKSQADFRFNVKDAMIQADATMLQKAIVKICKFFLFSRQPQSTISVESARSGETFEILLSIEPPLHQPLNDIITNNQPYDDDGGSFGDALSLGLAKIFLQLSGGSVALLDTEQFSRVQLQYPCGSSPDSDPTVISS